MRGDIARLGRCTAVTTQSEDTIKRSKPFKYAYEKEIVMSVISTKLHTWVSPLQVPSLTTLIGMPISRNLPTSPPNVSILRTVRL